MKTKERWAVTVSIAKVICDNNSDNGEFCNILDYVNEQDLEVNILDSEKEAKEIASHACSELFADKH